MNGRTEADRPRVRGVLETCVYCEDLDAAESFYSGVLGLELVGADRDRHLFYRCGSGMLLIFDPDATRVDAPDSVDQAVGSHGAKGSGHIAFAATEGDLVGWKTLLEAHGVEIESEIEWERGGRSIYFRDPAGNSLEFATPELWGFPDRRATAD